MPANYKPQSEHDSIMAYAQRNKYNDQEKSVPTSRNLLQLPLYNCDFYRHSRQVPMYDRQVSMNDRQVYMNDRQVPMNDRRCGSPMSMRSVSEAGNFLIIIFFFLHFDT